MRRATSHLLLPLLLAALPACKKEFEDRQPSPLPLVPAPREMQAEGDQPLGAALLLLPADPSERTATAAEEINLRLRELGAPVLRVATAGSKEADAWQGRRIELALAAQGDAAPVPEAPQGYWLDSTDPARTRLVGRDEQGLLWAAMTFRRLLRLGDDGGARVASARIRDWPDFPLRAANRLTSYHRDRSERGLLDAMKRSRGEPGRYADGYVYDTKRVMDFLARLKLNLVWLPLVGVPTELDALGRELGGEARADLFLATIRRATGHARARGLTLCDIVTPHVGISPEDDTDPAATRCVLLRNQRKFYCWSLDGHNRHRAEETAKLFARAGYGMAILQLPDGGGLANPGHWNGRCKDCQARWGDEPSTSLGPGRAAADAHLIRIWHDAFRQHAPGISLAALQYPSDPAILLQPDDPNCERTRAYLAGLHRLLPTGPPVAVCVRESASPAVAAFYKLFDGRPVLAKWMTDTTSGDHNWCPLFTTRARSAKTFQEPGREVWVLATSSGCAPLAAAAAAQFQWNASAPSAGLWHGSLEIVRDGAEPWPSAECGMRNAEYGNSALRTPHSGFDELLAGFVAEAFGERAAPCLLDAFKGCISPSYCLLPSDVARMAETPNTAARMRQQYDALVRASGGIEQLWQRFETGERHLIAAESAPCFYGLSEQVARSRVWASWHAASLRAAEALRNGEPKAAIAAELRAARQRIEADATLAARMGARLANRPTAGKAEFSRWYARSLRSRYDDTLQTPFAASLDRLLGVVEGRTLELRDAPNPPLPPRLLLPDDPQDVALRGKGATTVRFVSHPTQGNGRAALQAEGLTQPWHDGFSVGFPPVDVADHVKGGGVLRFYVNGGGAGNQQLTFWLYARDERGAASPADPKDWAWVSLNDYVAVDDLEATWQLVSIPLVRLLPRGYTRVVGFGMNNATHNEVCGPLWLDSMHVVAPGEPVEVEVPVQEPPALPPATQAQVLAYGVQTSTYVTGEGLASRLLLALKVTGNGTLSEAEIRLRVLAPDDRVLCMERVVAAPRLRTPWWSGSLRLDLGTLVPQARLEMTLRSKEVNETGAVQVKW